MVFDRCVDFDNGKPSFRLLSLRNLASTTRSKTTASRSTKFVLRARNACSVRSLLLGLVTACYILPASPADLVHAIQAFRLDMSERLQPSTSPSCQYFSIFQTLQSEHFSRRVVAGDSYFYPR